MEQETIHEGFNGSKLRSIRKSKNFTQKEFAEIIQISDSYLSRLETGEQFPSMKMLGKISKALGVSHREFF